MMTITQCRVPGGLTLIAAGGVPPWTYLNGGRQWSGLSSQSKNVGKRAQSYSCNGGVGAILSSVPNTLKSSQGRNSLVRRPAATKERSGFGHSIVQGDNATGSSARSGWRMSAAEASPSTGEESSLLQKVRKTPHLLQIYEIYIGQNCVVTFVGTKFLSHSDQVQFFLVRGLYAEMM
jgi:hypothetical protein